MRPSQSYSCPNFPPLFGAFPLQELLFCQSMIGSPRANLTLSALSHQHPTPQKAMHVTPTASSHFFLQFNHPRLDLVRYLRAPGRLACRASSRPRRCPSAASCRHVPSSAETVREMSKRSSKPVTFSAEEGGSVQALSVEATGNRRRSFGGSGSDPSGTKCPRTMYKDAEA